MKKSEIENHIKRLQNGRAATSDAHQIELIDLGLTKYRKMLAELEKKSVEPSENQGQLPDVEQRREQENKAQFFEERREKAKEEARYQKHMEEQVKNQHRDQSESAQVFEPNRVVIARIENPKPVAVPVVEMDFKDRYSNVYTRKLDQADIIALLKTYFKRVAVRMAKDGQYTDAYTSSMGQTVWKLFNGWHLIHKKTGEGVDYPVKEECFPGLKNASQAQKVCAELLHRWASNETP